MNLVFVVQEKNISVVVELYKIKISEIVKIKNKTIMEIIVFLDFII